VAVRLVVGKGRRARASAGAEPLTGTGPGRPAAGRGGDAGPGASPPWPGRWRPPAPGRDGHLLQGGLSRLDAGGPPPRWAGPAWTAAARLRSCDGRAASDVRSRARPPALDW